MWWGLWALWNAILLVIVNTVAYRSISLSMRMLVSLACGGFIIHWYVSGPEVPELPWLDEAVAVCMFVGSMAGLYRRTDEARDDAPGGCHD